MYTSKQKGFSGVVQIKIRYWKKTKKTKQKGCLTYVTFQNIQ